MLKHIDSAIIDRSHPQRNAKVAGRVLMMPAGRGSSSGSASLAEAIRVVGALVVGELYGLKCPVALASKRDWDEFAAAARLVVEAGPAETTIGIVP